jgi:hypothetical protein
MAADVGRNDPCPCGSGQKYKACCMGATKKGLSRRAVVALTIAGVGLIAAVVLGLTVSGDAASLTGAVAILAAVAWFFFAEPPSSKGSGNPGAINFGN